MTTLEHRTVLEAHAGAERARGMLAAAGRNAYLRLFAVLVVIAAGAALLALGIALVLDIVVPVIFGSELHALAALFPGLGR